jgi:hypothetical protein
MAVYYRNIKPGYIFEYYYFIIRQTNSLFTKPVNYYKNYIIALLIHGHGLEIYNYILSGVVGDREGF